MHITSYFGSVEFFGLDDLVAKRSLLFWITFHVLTSCRSGFILIVFVGCSCYAVMLATKANKDNKIEEYR